MIRPIAMQPGAAFPLALMGGATATILASALLYLAPAVGLPLLDIPLLVGGVLTVDSGLALGVGYGLFFLSGAFVVPFLLASVWSRLPGRAIGLVGAMIKGVIFGITFFVLSGVAVWILGIWNRLDGLASPSLFALNLGLGGPVVLLLIHLAYGLAAALVVGMAQGISPMDIMGWEGYRQAETPPVALEAQKTLNGHQKGYRAG